MSQHKSTNKSGFRCKHCKVEVISATDRRAVLGKVHKPWCPRSRL